MYLSESKSEVLGEEGVEHRVDATVHVGQHVGYYLRCHREVRDAVRVQCLHEQDYLQQEWGGCEGLESEYTTSKIDLNMAHLNVILRHSSRIIGFAEIYN